MAAYGIFLRLKEHTVTQHAIRITNMNVQFKGRMKLRVRAKLQPKIVEIIKEKIRDAMTDPDEKLYYSKVVEHAVQQEIQ